MKGFILKIVLFLVSTLMISCATTHPKGTYKFKVKPTIIWLGEDVTDLCYFHVNEHKFFGDHEVPLAKNNIEISSLIKKNYIRTLSCRWNKYVSDSHRNSIWFKPNELSFEALSSEKGDIGEVILNVTRKPISNLELATGMASLLLGGNTSSGEVFVSVTHNTPKNNKNTKVKIELDQSKPRKY